MTCPQTDHILDLYDNFCEAEIAYAQFIAKDQEQTDKATGGKCKKDIDAEREAYELEHEIVLTSKEAARVAMVDIGPPQSGIALLTLVAVNLTMYIWDLVGLGEIEWDPGDQNAVVDLPLHHNLILKAWHASLWLAGLIGDPRFSLETIAADLNPAPPD